MTYVDEMAVYHEPKQRTWFQEYTEGLQWNRLRDLDTYAGKPYRYLGQRMADITAWLILCVGLFGATALLAYVFGRAWGWI